MLSRFTLLNLIILLLAAVGCKKEENCIDPNLYVDTNPDRVAELESMSSFSALLGQDYYALDAYCWRNMMPHIVENDDDCHNAHMLISLVSLQNMTDSIYDDEIKFIRQFVINDNRIWTPPFSSEIRRSENEKISRHGPRWRIGTTVNIILEIEYLGDRFHLIQRNWPIDGPE